MKPNDIDTELIPHQTVTAIVENVQQAKLEVKEAFELLSAAKQRLNATLGDGKHGYYHSIIPNKNHYGDSVFEGKALADSMDLITQNAWRYILAQTGLNHFMTERRRRELHEQIEKNELPPLTVENIIGTLHGLSGRVNGLLEESIKEVFDWLRPHSDWGVGALKTNKKFQVGRKAIVYGVERRYGGGFSIRYSYEANFRALGNVFSLLDGKGVLKYPGDFYTRFNEAMREASAGDKFHRRLFRVQMLCKRQRARHIQTAGPSRQAEQNRRRRSAARRGKERR